MQKRTTIIGWAFDTASLGFTLSRFNLSPAVQKTHYVDIPGGHGSLDLSTVLTDGVPVYYDRTLDIGLEISEGTREDRDGLFQLLRNALGGRALPVIPPDYATSIVNGNGEPVGTELYINTRRFHVAVDYNDLAHGALTITAECDPLLYKLDPVTETVTLSSTVKDVPLMNNGGVPVVPTITVTGEALLSIPDGPSRSFSAGTYQWPDLLIPADALAGINYANVHCSGTGSVTFTWQEAFI